MNRVKTRSRNISYLVKNMKGSFLQGLENSTMVISNCAQYKYSSDIENRGFIAAYGVGDVCTVRLL